MTKVGVNRDKERLTDNQERMRTQHGTTTCRAVIGNERVMIELRYVIGRSYHSKDVAVEKETKRPE